MTSREIRQTFLDFFKERGHEIEKAPSSPVVPHDDPTLMFANAGMNQFKDVFLGTGSRSYTRAANTQKCIRAGGKHNDLDDVGKDTYHQTYFEMLGNWSFGDYFKEDAIRWAWELLTKVYGIEKERLHATYFEGDAGDNLDADEEAARLWGEVTDIDPSHIHPGNKKDNFWEMGESGPCGPCSEIHIDLTPDMTGHDLVNAGHPKVIEIWNLVFIQYNRGGDGVLSPLPAQHVDTGMGFERLCAVLAGSCSNYDTDVFSPIFDAIQKRCSAPDYKFTQPELVDGKLSAKMGPDTDPQVMIDMTYRVVADHVRCLVFALTDGAIPSNEGRGYVLRRILRRAVRYGRQYFNMQDPFLCDLVMPVVEQLKDVFPELSKRPEHVIELIRDEEASFGKTLTRGIQLFNEAAEYAETHHHSRISGDDAFKLHDTYGFPIDLTELMAEERGMTVDFAEYQRLMEAAREKARSTRKLFFEDDTTSARLHPGVRRDTNVVCHEKREESNTMIVSIRKGERAEQSSHIIEENHSGWIILRDTPFYAEKGGQVGDRGRITCDGSIFIVDDTIEFQGLVLHHGKCIKGEFFINDASLEDPEEDIGRYHKIACASVDPVYRDPTEKNHTATHLLNWALRETLGEYVQQKGSLVDPDKTRFDFSHNAPVKPEELARIESMVNEQIRTGLQVYTEEVDQKNALEINTLRAVFGEKYPDVVRVVSIGQPVTDLLANPKNPEWMKYSVEFCGGTHLQNTSEAEDFVIVAEEAVAKGVRRLVGVTGEAAKNARQRGAALLDRAKAMAKAPTEDLPAALTTLQQDTIESEIPVAVTLELRDLIANLQKEAKRLSKEQASASAGDVMSRVAELFASAENISDVTLVIGNVPTANADALRGAIDWVRQKTEASVVLLGCHAEGKVTLIAGVSKTVVGRGVKAGDIIREIAPIVGGKGGGRPDMAQGGGNQPENIPKALERGKTWLTEKLG